MTTSQTVILGFPTIKDQSSEKGAGCRRAGLPAIPRLSKIPLRPGRAGLLPLKPGRWEGYSGYFTRKNRPGFILAGWVLEWGDQNCQAWQLVLPRLSGPPRMNCLCLLLCAVASLAGDIPPVSFRDQVMPQTLLDSEGGRQCYPDLS